MITTTSSTPTNASASLWPGNSAKLRLTQPVHPTTATASNPVRFPGDQTRGLAPIAGVGVFALLVILFMSQSVRLGWVYLTGPIVFVVGRAVLGRTLISGGSTTQHHRDDLGADALTTLPNSSRFSCAVPLPSRAGSFLLVSRSISAGYLVPRGLFPDIRVWPALLLTAALAPTDDRGMDSPVIKGTSDLASICPEIRRESSLVDSEPPKAGKLLMPTLNDQEGAPRRWPLPRDSLRGGPRRAPRGRTVLLGSSRSSIRYRCRILG